jgi:hypothetical protein
LRYFARAFKRATLVASLAVVSLLSIGTPAASAADSGWQFRNKTGPYWPGWFADNCVRSTISFQNGLPWFYSEVRSSVSSNGCGGGLANMQQGWLSSLAWGIRDGGVCGFNPQWSNSAWSTGLWGTGGNLCANPPGLQEFSTLAFNRVWQNGAYVELFVQGSPGQNF